MNNLRLVMYRMSFPKPVNLFGQTCQISTEIMRNLILETLSAHTSAGTPGVLTPWFEDVGVRIVRGSLKFFDEPVDTLIVSILLGTSKAWTPFYIMGTVYSDVNADGLNSLGEAIVGARITIESSTDNPGPIVFRETATNSGGAYLATVSGVGPYRLSIDLPNDTVLVTVVGMEAENLWIDHLIPSSATHE